MSEPVPQADPQPTPEPQPAPDAPTEQPAASTTPATVWVRYAGVPRGFTYQEPLGDDLILNWTPGRTEELPADRAATLLDLPGFEIGTAVAVPRQP